VTVQRISAQERRARLYRRHLLDPATSASSVAEVAETLVAIHSTDPATVYLSVWARTSGLDASAIEHELYEERTVARMLGMRRTLFVVPRATRPVVQAACTDEIAVRERARLVAWIAATPGIDDAQAWLAEAEEAALVAVEAAGEASTAELVRSVPILATKLEVGSGRWLSEVSAGSRVLPLLAAQGKLLRGRPRGTWISGQYRWTSSQAWLGAEQQLPPADEARAALVRGWLAAFGPGTELDVRWWTGLGARPVRAALAAIGAVEVDLDGATGFVLPDDVDPVEIPEPSAALLPTLDSTTMGWKERDWYLGPEGQVLFDSNGNAGPTVWWEGRVVGGWSQRADGEIVYRLLEDVGSKAIPAIEAEAASLREWLGDVRFKPGFLPPFQRELGS
jgi:hypothetical protein